VPSLEVSVPEVRGDQAWPLEDNPGRPLTGRGQAIAFFDTGVDVFQPALWKADGGLFDWLDVNGDGVFTPGVDAVDLNRNGQADPGEGLRYFKTQITLWGGGSENSGGEFVADLDWLYNDANGNGVRDYGAFYGESQPTFGERLFLVEDGNGNKQLDPDEKLLALGSSKVAYTISPGVSPSQPEVHSRGTDLASAPRESVGHGTAVAGILAGETPGKKRRFVGLAPEADLLAADAIILDPFLYMNWAQNHGATLMLHELGAWVWEFLDGSSVLEGLMDEKSAAGIPQVVPAGNLAGRAKHAEFLLPAGGEGQVRFSVTEPGIPRVYFSFLWRDSVPSMWPGSEPPSITFRITNPAEETITLSGDGSLLEDGTGHSYWSNWMKSDRGTIRFDVLVEADSIPELAAGTWRVDISSQETQIPQLHGYVFDPAHGWGGGVVFLDWLSDFHTIAHPATADSAIVVAAYSTRGYEGVTVGDRSPSSSQGPRIDGRPVVAVSAPGNLDVYTTTSEAAGEPFASIKYFGGTSAAGAHVAGALTLVRQRQPDWTVEQLRQRLRETARRDGFTGAVPNESWGYGKLDVLAAVATFALQGDAANQTNPSVSMDRIVWQDDRNGNWDIYGYDLLTRQEFAVCVGPGDQINPRLSGNRVVWQDNRSGDWDIYALNLLTGEEEAVCVAPGDQTDPDISGKHVVWADHRETNWHIYLWDFETRAETRLSDDFGDHLFPAICEDRVAWQDNENGDWDITLHELATGSQTKFPASGDQVRPALSPGGLVWQDNRNGDWDICGRDLETGQEFCLSQRGSDEVKPRISFDLVVWEQAGPGEADIYGFDLGSWELRRITLDPGDQVTPDVSNRLVVWADGRGLSWDIYRHDISLSYFDDIPLDFWARYQIEALRRAGIVRGTSTNPPLYSPATPVSRDQMAVFIIRSLGEQPVFPPTPRFTDVPADYWAYGEIERLAELGVVQGCTLVPARYCPSDLVTRSQMAVFVVRALGLPAVFPPTPSFADVPAEQYAYGWVEALKTIGVTRGCQSQPPLLYCPEVVVTRDQMAVFIQRGFGPSY
jgi:beta propeller repeat protein